MRALVVYESMYGNTRVVASNIADGLRATHQVRVVPVAEAGPDLLASADLLVLGGPTHMHGMSSGMTRRMATRAAGKPGSTFGPFLSYSPRNSKCVSRGGDISSITIVVGMLSSNFANSARAASIS